MTIPHITPKQFVEYRAVFENGIRLNEECIERFRELAVNCPLPEKLRPMIATDVVVGQVVWYQREDVDEGFPLWQIVEEIRDPRDKWKAFISNGCRYGLDGAFVEVDG
jgi:hypothetical protein